MMANPSPDAGLNENHRRHVMATFRHLDELLAKAEHIMATAGSSSPFNEFLDDTTPLQRKAIHDHIQRLRELMCRQLEALHVPRPAPVTSARWAARNSLAFAKIALAEMEARRLGGFGKLSSEAAQRMNACVAELRAALEKLDDDMEQGDLMHLQARLQQLASSGSAPASLRELERLATQPRGGKYRDTLAMLVERLENGTLEIGVFGRVKSGKSALLNYLLGGDHLPVGVTPVTIVPIYISYGEQAQGWVDFADGRSEAVEWSALAEFATEQNNPGNKRHVARVRVAAPCLLLREGITLVDTPGTGSLLAGAAELAGATLARCDIGIVLVDATSVLMQEDLKMIEALAHAGAKVVVLVSKADLLEAAERECAVDYVRAEVRKQAHLELPVFPVSVRGAGASLCEVWLDAQLRPLLDTPRVLAAASLNRKTALLRESLLDASIISKEAGNSQ